MIEYTVAHLLSKTMERTNRPIIYVVLGYSRTGKDTVAKWLNKNRGAVTVKFSGPMKRIVEKQNNLPHLALEDNAYRNAKVKDAFGDETDQTYLDLMLAAFEHWLAVDPHCMLKSVKNTLESLLAEKKLIVMNDLRNLEEARLVQYVLDKYDAKLTLVVMRRDGVKPKTSDRYIGEIYSRLAKLADREVIIQNNGSIENLYTALSERM